MANQFKEKGNEQFRNKNWEKALEYFSQAIQLDGSNHIFYSNRSATYFQLKQYSKSLEDADTVVEMQPNWSKGYIRQGSALFALGVYTRAKKSFETGVGLDPSNQELVTGLARSQIALQITRLLPNGLLAQVPIFFDQNKRIDWERDLPFTASSPLTSPSVDF
uniref:Uncharacterized protein n=1 Tax=Arcella intermedia TaxID=1963864 RepID=A0A6B2LMD4_9EUKA